MSAPVNSSRHVTVNRTTASHRQVVVPDRMTLRASKATSPIINLQSTTVATQAKNQPVTKRQPIASANLHANTQIAHRKKVVRPAAHQSKVLAVSAMSTLLERHNALPKHLARTAGRAHLLSQAVQSESQKLRWHQRVFAFLAT